MKTTTLAHTKIYVGEPIPESIRKKFFHFADNKHDCSSKYKSWQCTRDKSNHKIHVADCGTGSDIIAIWKTK